MSKSDPLVTLSRAFPKLARFVIELSTSGKLPVPIHKHWIVENRLIPELFRDGITSTINGMVFDVPTVVAAWYRNFEPVTQTLIERSLRPGMVFVDVGANVGYFSVLADRIVGPDGLVHAFEPSPPTLPMLRRNLARHGVRHVEVHEFALGETNGLREFNHTIDQLNDGFVPGPYAPVIRTERIVQKRLDDVLQGKVDFVKMDIQGTEIEVLRGMERIIRENEQISFLVEWAPACMKPAGYRAQDLPEFFSRKGFFQMRAVDDFSEDETHSVEEMLRIFATDATGLRYCNLFVSPRKAP
ncbi:MAG: FkbM family methyltransferase [Methylocella sp.]